MTSLQFNNITHQPLLIDHSLNNGIALSVLRLDKLHPIISGNKWFKIQLYLQDGIQKKCTTIVTAGGAYSNHIAAVAFACKLFNLKSIGIIRGEADEKNITLSSAKEWGMDLHFVSREQFRNKAALKEHYTKNCYWIEEGGYGLLGSNGAANIHQHISTDATHIICATGTGTTFAGLIKAALPYQTVIGINVLKGNHSITDEINNLLSNEEQKKKYQLINAYHFGGYAKHPPQLIEFMKQLWHEHQLPTDIVYTSKMMFAVFDLLQQNYFPANSNIVIVHSGGLQGNFSLPLNTLPF